MAVAPVSHEHTMATRAKSGYRMPARPILHAAGLSPVPKTYRSALVDPNWRAAMVEEHDALLQNHTWDLVPRPAGGQHSHWEVDLQAQVPGGRIS